MGNLIGKNLIIYLMYGLNKGEYKWIDTKKIVYTIGM